MFKFTIFNNLCRLINKISNILVNKFLVIEKFLLKLIKTNNFKVF